MPFPRAPRIRVTLLLSADTAKPGDTVLAGVDLQMDPGWHTYWKNPGEAGIPTAIKWDLPPGVTAGDIQWPLPHKLPPADVTTYGYVDEVMLIVPLSCRPTQTRPAPQPPSQPHLARMPGPMHPRQNQSVHHPEPGHRNHTIYQ